MANVDPPTDDNGQSGKKFGDGRAERTDVSLSQAILSPLDAIFKAQLHGARSFLNLLLQLGYRGNEKDDGDGKQPRQADGTPFNVTFNSEVSVDGKPKKYQITVPALSLIPVQPIAIDSAEYELQLTVRNLYHHGQTQKIRRKEDGAKEPDQRPWYLVQEPLSIRGVLATPVQGALPPNEASGLEENYQGSTIKVKVNVKKAPMPAGLSKLLTTLTEMSDIKAVGEPPATSPSVDVVTSEDDSSPPINPTS